MQGYYRLSNFFAVLAILLIIGNFILKMFVNLSLISSLIILGVASIFIITSLVFLNKIYYLLLHSSNLTLKEVIISNVEKILLGLALLLLAFSNLGYILFIISIFIKIVGKTSELDYNLEELCQEFDKMALELLEDEDEIS